MTEAFNPLENAVFTTDKRIDAVPPVRLRQYVEEFWNHKELLYKAAFAEHQRVITERLNWRNFGVGAAALAVNSKTGETAIITGYNSKEDENTQKHCAEKRLFQSAIDQGFDTIAGLVVVAEHQPDDQSSHQCTTLHPCEDCRHLLADSPLAFGELPIVTMTIPPSASDVQGEYNLVEEQHTLTELIAKHASDTPS